LCPLCRQQWENDNQPWGPRDAWGPREPWGTPGDPAGSRQPPTRPNTLPLPLESNQRKTLRKAVSQSGRSSGRGTIAQWIAGAGFDSDACRHHLEATQLPHVEGLSSEQLAAASEWIKVNGKRKPGLASARLTQGLFQTEVNLSKA